MRASRILGGRPDRAIMAIAQLCEEREESPVPTPSLNSTFTPPRLSLLPPQTPYTIGSSPMRPTEVHMPVPDRLTQIPPSQSASQASDAQAGPSRSPPEHMAPKRGKWTSPPPPEAPLA